MQVLTCSIWGIRCYFASVNMNASTIPSSIREKIILGIDPGSNIMGYAVLCQRGSEVSLLTYGIERFSSADEHLLRVKQIYERTAAIIEKYLPDEMAIEAPFFGKNIQAMLKLGRAQGACISAALARDIPVTEYAPKKVKQSVTGKGTATKEQVAYMMRSLLKIDPEHLTFDATDALAIALCHHYSKGVQGKAGSKSWGSFLAENPGRLKVA